VPPQPKKPEVELENLIPAARRLAKRLSQSILMAKKLRRGARQAETRLKPSNALRHVPVVAKGKPREGDELQARPRKANIVPGKLLDQLLDVKTRIEISLLRPNDRYGPLREALEKLTFATDALASNRWPAAVSFDEESVLGALGSFEMILDAVPLPDREGPGKIELSGTLQNGQFCDQVIDEIRRIRHLHPANTVAQIKTTHPNFLVWTMIDDPDVDAEDRDIFFHPLCWGPVVG